MLAIAAPLTVVDRGNICIFLIVIIVVVVVVVVTELQIFRWLVRFQLSDVGVDDDSLSDKTWG